MFWQLHGLCKTVNRRSTFSPFLCNWQKSTVQNYRLFCKQTVLTCTASPELPYAFLLILFVMLSLPVILGEVTKLLIFIPDHVSCVFSVKLFVMLFVEYCCLQKIFTSIRRYLLGDFEEQFFGLDFVYGY